MSTCPACVVVVGVVSLGLAVLAPPTVAEPMEPVTRSGCSTLPPTSQPSPAIRAAAGQQVKATRDSGRIAFLTRKHNVSVMDADGRHVRRLTDFGNSWDLTWSPDGRKILLQRFGDEERPPQVWVVAAGSGRARPLTDPDIGAMGASWSPDGREIAYTSSSAGRGPAVFVMAADGTDQRRVTSSPVVLGLGTTAWAPNGRWIAFSTSRSTDEEAFERVLGLVRPDGSKVRHLAKTRYYNLIGIKYHPVWSPDGLRVAWSTESRGVEVFDPRGGLVFETNGYNPVWSPNGRRIAFSSCSGGEFLMRADGTKVRRLLVKGPVEAWSPDGRRLLISQSTEGKERWRSLMKVVRSDGRQVRTLGEGYQPDWFGAAPTRTRVNAAPEPVRKKARLLVSGKMTRLGVALTSATVRIRFKAVGRARFTTVRTATTNANGRFHIAATARKTGTWKAIHPATPATFASSATDKVTVRPG